MTSPEPTPPVHDTEAAENSPAWRGIFVRKFILSVILACSVLYFFGILFAGLFAVAHAAAPHDSAPFSYTSATAHSIYRHIAQLYHWL